MKKFNIEKHIISILILFTLFEGWLVVSGFFTNPATYGVLQIAALLVLVVLLLIVFLQKLKPLVSPDAAPKGITTDTAMGLLLITVAYAILQMTSHLHVDLYPILYLLILFLAFSYHIPLVISCLIYSFLIEAGILFFSSNPHEDLHALLSHVVFLMLFSVLYYIVRWSDVRLRRLEHRAQVERHIKDLEEKAMGYRLVPAGQKTFAMELPEEERAQRLRMSGVLVIKKALTNQLQIIRHLVKARTVALYMLDQEEKNLRLIEASSDSEKLRVSQWIPPGEGIIGSAITQRKSIAVSSSRRGCKGINWYLSEEKTIAAAAVPLIQEASGTQDLQGVLTADRGEGTPFEEDEVALLRAMATEVMRTIEVEQVVLDIDRERNQKEKFYETSRRLGEALTLNDVLKATVDVARTIREYDFAVITLLVDEEKRTQKIAHLFSKSIDLKEIEGMTFPEGSYLVSSVLKHGIPLPSKNFFEMERQCIFPECVPLRDIESIKVLPLTMQKRSIGTLTVGLRHKHHFGSEEMSMLRTVASLAAIAIENGKLYERMEHMAITDGLTGLFNHRMFQEKLNEALQRALRFNRKTSMILMDIDHFKKINDMHGHPTGDAVLKGIARVLRSSSRAIDIIARYGGEEFAIILEDTDQKGGKVKAERIREDVSRIPFRSEYGTFNVTISLGIATYPDDAQEKKELILKADEALYYAKHAGRNQSHSWHLIQRSGRREINRFS